MSLLSNLLSYSTLSFRESTILSPKQDERSRSTLNLKKHDQPSHENQKTVSKSLSKISSMNEDVKIDPKVRILHRVSHLISKKCRKHYYTLFVTLQTVRRKKLYLQEDGEWGQQKPIYQNKNMNNLQSKQNKQRKNNINLQQLKPVMSKIQQIQNIYLMKTFQSAIKQEIFHLLRVNSQNKVKMNIFEMKLVKIQQKMNKKNVMKKLKVYNHFVFKIELLTSFVDGLVKKYEFGRNQRKLWVKKVFCQIKSLSQQIKQKIEVKQIKQQQSNSNPVTPIKISKFEQNNQKQLKTIKKALTFDNIIELHSQSNILRAASKVPSLDYLIQKNETLTFQNNKQTMLKSMNVKLSLSDEAFVFDDINVNEQKSSICHKLAVNPLFNNLPDEYDENIFIENKLNNFNRVNRFKQSRVMSLKTNRVDRNSWRNLNVEIKNNQADKIQNIDVSQVSAISMLRSEKSANTLIQQCNKLNFSAFGGQAVSFKNSLVRERELLQEGEKMFQKKFYQDQINHIIFNVNANQQPQKDVNLNFKKINQHSNNMSHCNNMSGSGINEQYWTRPSSFDKKNKSNVILNYSNYENQNNFISSAQYHHQQMITPTRDGFNNKDAVPFLRKNSEERIITFNAMSVDGHKPKNFIKLMKRQ